MQTSRWIFHPVAILVYSILALASSLFLYIYWYVEASSAVRIVAKRLNADPSQFSSYQTWVVISILSILVGIILMDIIIFFVYNIKIQMLYKAQRNFINNFTHELKTPVTSIALYLETFLAHDLEKSERDRFVGYMLSDVARLTDNIQSILNLARMESQSYSEKMEAADLVETVRRICRENGHRLPNAEIVIEEPADWPILCRLNVPLFEMLVVNILTNAIKYNESQKPGVRISFTPGKRKVTIKFSDNGIGLEKKHLKKIFNKFYQAGNPNTRTARGNGLGLYLVHGVTRIHKGKISALSEGPGMGSTFILKLPILKA
ncbi:MAG: HAMP domain-containing histidine kinase [Deltaproteobacteria bacterium]|nr:HAMP domain-containing histidine kinase [Deltaproteobacteria bacterium]